MGVGGSRMTPICHQDYILKALSYFSWGHFILKIFDLTIVNFYYILMSVNIFRKKISD